MIPARRRLTSIALVGIAAALPLYGGFATYKICTVGPEAQALKQAPKFVDDRALLGLSEAELLNKFGMPSSGVKSDDWDALYFLRRTDLCMTSEWLAIAYGDDRVVEDADILRR